MKQWPLPFLILAILVSMVREVGAITVRFDGVTVEGEAKTVGKRRVVEYQWFKEDEVVRFRARSIVKVTDGRAPKLSRSTRHSYLFWYYLNDDPGIPAQYQGDMRSIGFQTTFYGRRIIRTNFGTVVLKDPIDWSSSRTRKFRGTATVTMNGVAP